MCGWIVVNPVNRVAFRDLNWKAFELVQLSDPCV
jgi:hypothetical protein